MHLEVASIFFRIDVDLLDKRIQVVEFSIRQ